MRLEHHKLFEWFGMMHGCYAAMPQQEKDALREWENVHVGGRMTTSDWPGWEKYIGKRPTFPARENKDKAVIPAKLRWAVFKRDAFKCVDCGSQDDLAADHEIPESKGGPTTLENLRTRCRSCNSKKGTKQAGRESELLG